MADSDELCEVLDGISASLSSTREAVHSILEQAADYSTSSGISLLSLKSHMLLSYMHALALITAHRVLPGPSSSLSRHTPPPDPYSLVSRPARGADAGDLVDACIDFRVVLEKIRPMESQMRYQIDKLVKLAQQPEEAAQKDVLEDPLAFRPNPQNLVAPDRRNMEERGRERAAQEDDEDDDERNIYRPPKVAPTPYPGTSAKSRRGASRKPAALSNLLHVDPVRPALEPSSGLGAAAAAGSQSNHARAVRRYTEFEEENFTRLVMGKKDARRRAREEQQLALGGDVGAIGSGRSRVGGLEGEFVDLLNPGARRESGDGYEELRKRGKKEAVLERSRVRSRDDVEFEGVESGNMRKKGRFEKEAKIAKKALRKKKTLN